MTPAELVIEVEHAKRNELPTVILLTEDATTLSARIEAMDALIRDVAALEKENGKWCALCGNLFDWKSEPLPHNERCVVKAALDALEPKP